MTSVRRAGVVAVVVALVALLAACEPVPERVFVVSSTADGQDATPGDGVCQTATPGECTLRAAVMEANASPGHDLVELAAGATYALSPALGGLVLGDSVSLAGNGSTIDGQAGGVVLHVPAGSQAWVRDVTVRGGDGGGDGGGLLNEGLIYLSGVTVTANHADGDGGGIANRGQLRLFDSSVVGNTADGNGGGLANLADAVILGSTIDSNSAAGGGGVFSDPSGNVVVEGSTVSNNVSETGGGLFGGSVLLLNVTVSGNEAGTGGGLFTNGAVTAGYVTVTDNTATTPEAKAGIDGDTSSVALHASIVAGNAGSDCSAGVASGGYNLDGDGSCLVSLATGDQPGVDAQLEPLADNGGPTLTHLPATGSPAIDAIPVGTPQLCEAQAPIDQIDQRRPVGAGCDAGAVEVGANTVWVWGSNSNSALGLGDDVGTTLDPTQMGTGNDWVKVSSGNGYNLAIKADGTLWAWGSNASGRTGLNTDVGNTVAPTQVGTGDDWVEVSAGSTHALAIKADGTLWAWGANPEGQLGLGFTSTTGVLEPTQVGTDDDWAAVSASRGGNHSLAIKADGTLWAWGDNNAGQVGIGFATNNVPSPTKIGTATDWVEVSAGGVHSLAIRDDGTLWAWGSNLNGRTGLGTTTGTRTSPAKVGTDTDWAEISAADVHSLALKSDGTLWAWGSNANGRTGFGTTAGDTSVPTQVGTDDDWQAVSARNLHSLALKSGGTLWAWGDNSLGRTGLGTSTGTTLVPTQVGTDTDWVAVSAGFEHSIAMRS